MLSDEQIEVHLEDMEKELKKNDNKRPVKLSADWIKEFPGKAGIYVAWEDGKDNPVYVGETGNIRGRMRDLQDSRHHNLRRSIGKQNFSGKPGYKSADSKHKFPTHIEEKVNTWLKEKIRISVLATKLGRKELEERICEEYTPIYNEKGQRKSD